MRISTDPVFPPDGNAPGDNSPQGVVIRPYAPADAYGCHATFQAAVHIGAARHYDAAARMAWAPPGPMPADWPDQLGDQMTWVAEAGGRIAGFLTLGRDGHLDLFYVAPRWMGRGVAGRLHDQALCAARTMGIAMLSTEASHLARAFLLRNGWHSDARQSVIRHSTAITNFRMSRRIDPAPACVSPMPGK
ncbi:MAG: GNAT family N-acetyltransferase [Paracoccaceae bacterium]